MECLKFHSPQIISAPFCPHVQQQKHANSPHQLPNCEVVRGGSVGRRASPPSNTNNSDTKQTCASNMHLWALAAEWGPSAADFGRRETSGLCCTPAASRPVVRFGVALPRGGVCFCPQGQCPGAQPTEGAQRHNTGPAPAAAVVCGVPCQRPPATGLRWAAEIRVGLRAFSDRMGRPLKSGGKQRQQACLLVRTHVVPRAQAQLNLCFVAAVHLVLNKIGTQINTVHMSAFSQTGGAGTWTTTAVWAVIWASEPLPRCVLVQHQYTLCKIVCVRRFYGR